LDTCRLKISGQHIDLFLHYVTFIDEVFLNDSQPVEPSHGRRFEGKQKGNFIIT